MANSQFTYRVLGWIAVAASVILALRLAIGVAATPTNLWMSNFVPLTTATTPAALPGIVHRASTWLTDPAVGRSLIGDCVSVPGPPSQAAECLAAIDYGLASNPSSSELWLARAKVLSRQGIFDERLVASLANSYATGKYEGWVAANRLPFALRMQAYLPPEMIDDIGGDVTLVVPDHQLSSALIAAYIADPFLRETTWNVIEQYATFDQQEQLIAWIRQEL